MKTMMDINGIPVEAYYHDEDVERIFQPLLEMLGRMQKEKGRRLIVMIAAPPGTGKSTLACFLEELAREHLPGMRLQSVGMDSIGGRII